MGQYKSCWDHRAFKTKLVKKQKKNNNKKLTAWVVPDSLATSDLGTFVTKFGHTGIVGATPSATQDPCNLKPLKNSRFVFPSKLHEIYMKNNTD